MQASILKHKSNNFIKNVISSIILKVIKVKKKISITFPSILNKEMINQQKIQ
jgi:hypothetical protein